jgi:hypothetical protein
LEPSKKTKRLLDELDQILVNRDRESVVENKAMHIIQSAINLMNYIRENYSQDDAENLEKRLLNSIRSHEPEKFSRGIRRIRNSVNLNADDEDEN